MFLHRVPNACLVHYVMVLLAPSYYTLSTPSFQLSLTGDTFSVILFASVPIDSWDSLSLNHRLSAQPCLFPHLNPNHQFVYHTLFEVKDKNGVTIKHYKTNTDMISYFVS